MQGNTWKYNILHSKKKISLLKYNAEKKFTPLYVGEKIFNSPDVWNLKSHTPPQIQMINPLGVGEETKLVNDQQNGWSSVSSNYISTQWFGTDGMRKRRTN